MGQHFVPQRYLRNFEDRDVPGSVWLHVKGAEAAKLLPVKVVAQAKRFYSADDENALERKIERPGNAVIQKLVRGEPITIDERADMTAYVGAMMMRIPARRAHAATLYPSTRDKTFANIRKVVDDLARDGEISDSRAAFLLDQISDLESQYQEQLPESVMEQVRTPFARPRVLNAIMNMTWRILRSRDEGFITSDNPVFFFSWRGIGRPTSELSFPLSTTVALHGSYQGQPRTTLFGDADRRIVKEINSRTFSGRSELLFSNEPRRWLLSSKPLRRMLSEIRW